MKTIYRNKQLVAVSKPAGAPVYGDRKTGCREQLERHFQRRVFPIHRLDKDTAGILIFAFDARSAAEIGSTFKQRKVVKGYRAIVWGRPPAQGSIKTPLRKHKSKETQSAQTDYRVERVGQIGDFTLSVLRIVPKTGRYHQIRRHLKDLGFPIVGDTTYGNRTLDEQIFKQLKVHSMMLMSDEIFIPATRTRKQLHLKIRAKGQFEKVERMIDSTLVDA